MHTVCCPAACLTGTAGWRMDMSKITIMKRLFAVLLSAAMLVSMSPFLGFDNNTAYAAESAPGGTVESDDGESLADALGRGNLDSIGQDTTGGKSIITATLKTTSTEGERLPFIKKISKEGMKEKSKRETIKQKTPDKAQAAAHPRTRSSKVSNRSVSDMSFLFIPIAM